MQNVRFTSYLLKYCFAHAETSLSQTRKVEHIARFFVWDVANNKRIISLQIARDQQLLCVSNALLLMITV